MEGSYIGIDFNKLRIMNDYHERVDGGEDIFEEIEDVYLNNFIKDMALISAPTEDFTGGFRDIVDGLREKTGLLKLTFYVDTSYSMRTLCSIYVQILLQ